MQRSILSLGAVAGLLTGTAGLSHPARRPTETLMTLAQVGTFSAATPLAPRIVQLAPPPLDADSIVVIGGDSVVVPTTRELATLHLDINPRALAVGTRTLRAGVQPLDSLHWADTLHGGDSLGGAYVYVPPQCVGSRRCPLLVLLHGLSMTGLQMLVGNPKYEHIVSKYIVNQLADSTGIIVLAPSADDADWTPPTWKRSRNLHKVDAALRYVLRHYAIDPTRIALGGASNGGGMALTVGLANGDLFSRVVGISPAINVYRIHGSKTPLWIFYPDAAVIMASVPRRGTPPIFIQHGDTGQGNSGTEYNANVFVQQLRQQGYTVTYAVDADGHGMPPARASAAFHWLAASWGGGTRNNRGTIVSPPRPAGHP